MTEYNLPQVMLTIALRNTARPTRRMAPRTMPGMIPRLAARIVPRLPQFLLGLSLCLMVGATAQASERWDSQLTSFAKKIAAVSGPATATLDMRNLSSLPAEQASSLRRTLESQLRAAGVQLRPEHEASVGIRVTLSTNRRGWLWIAEIQQGAEIRVTMLEVSEERAAATGAGTKAMTLQSSLLFSTSDILLDVQPLGTPQPTLAALTTRSALLYEQQGGRWKLLRELPLPLQVSLPRDPRGRIVPASDHPFDLFFPGGNCAAAQDRAISDRPTGDRAGAPANAIALSCIASDDPWPLGGQSAVYNPARNYFTGVLLPGIGRAMAPFYSAAPISQAKYTLWIFAGVDGRVSSFDGANERRFSGAARAWGSDLAALHSGCGSGTQLLATESGAGTPSDSLQAFEIADREPLAASAPLKFNGSITALWSTLGAKTATAVVHTAQGGYDAYSVSLACGE